MRIPLSELPAGRVEEWNAIALSPRHGNIFHHPAWSLGCLDAFTEAAGASLYATTRHGRLSTLGTFRFTTESVLGLPMRLRVGRFLLHELADYNGFLSDAPNPTEDVLAILDETRRAEKWEILKLKDISCLDPMLVCLRALRERGYPYTLLKGNLCPFLPLEGRFDEYLARQLGPSSSHVKTFRRVLRQEGFSVSGEEAAPAGDLRIDEFADIEGQSWKAETGLFATPQKRRFYQSVLSRLHAEGRLQYLTCRIAGKPTAYVLGFYSGDRWMFYTTAYKPEDKRLSVGKAAVLLALERMFAKGLKEVDFMRGAENSKYLLTDSARQNYELYLFASPAAKAAFDAARYLRRKAKQTLKRKAYAWPGSVQEYDSVPAGVGA